MNKKVSLSKRIMTYIIVSGFIFGLSIMILSLVSILNHYEDAYVKMNRERVERVKESFDKELLTVESTVSTLAVETEILFGHVMNDKEKTLNALEKDYYDLLSCTLAKSKVPSKDVFVYINPFIDNAPHDIWLTRDEAGRIIRNQEIPLERYKSRENMAWYYDVVESGRGLWINTYSNRYGEVNSPYIEPIRYKDQIVGVIGMCLNINHLEELLQQIDKGQDAFSWIIDESDHVVYHPKFRSGVSLEEMGYHIYGEGWESSYSEDIVNKTTSRHFVGITAHRWKLIYTMSEMEYLKYKLELIKRMIFVFIGLSLLFYFLNCYFMKGYVADYRDILKQIKNNKSDGRRIPIDLAYNTDVGCIIESINSSYLEIDSLKDKIDQITHYNRITGLPNWIKMRDELDDILAKDYHEYISVFDIDIDFFKKINELFGHNIGDEVLRRLASKFKEIESDELKFYHTDGDAFVAIVTGTMCKKINSVATRIQALVHSVSYDAVYDVRLSCSMGISCYPEHGSTSAELLKYAEVGLYNSKLEGKNRFTVFKPEMYHQLTASKELEDDFVKALEDEEFCVHYQPKFDVLGHIVGIEALVRWQHPDKGLLYPNYFIEYAEQTGLITILGKFVLRTACRDFNELKNIGNYLEHVAVNISSRELLEADFVSSTLKVLQETSIHTDEIELEVTESMLIYERERSIKKLEQLVDLGVSISLDDFGSGYASINNIKDLPISRIKVDRLFICDIEENPRVIKMLGAVIEMAHELELSVTVEGVETKRQQTLLVDCDADELQGFYLAKPMSIEALRALLIKG